jgi:hypothetical protein
MKQMVIETGYELETSAKGLSCLLNRNVYGLLHYNIRETTLMSTAQIWFIVKKINHGAVAYDSSTLIWDYLQSLWTNLVVERFPILLCIRKDPVSILDSNNYIGHYQTIKYKGNEIRAPLPSYRARAPCGPGAPFLSRLHDYTETHHTR